ncbi:MAG: hypothetical protein KDK91_31195 [Gammaproteobacteria bacterium]|nr:hypothetical protein [Gammaproteobacteria bacterium]
MSTETAARGTLVKIVRTEATPVVDGDLREWPASGWQRIPLAPALEDDQKNRTGDIEIDLQAVVTANRLYVAVRWPDPTLDDSHRPWLRQGGRYRRGKARDDMFALRLHKSGDFDRSMLATHAYSVDVWLWSAGRSNHAGLAEDWMHIISPDPIENAAEHGLPGGGSVYIRKIADGGEPIYRFVKPSRTSTESQVESVALSTKASESQADVAARGRWRDGHWHLELARDLDTGHDDDVQLVSGQAVLGQVAVFNQGYAGHKSVSEPLRFEMAIR